MQPALAISQLSKTYDGNFQALKGISLTVKQGDFFALLGPNGAGKSTTIGIICSLVLKTSGTVSIFGCDIDTDFSQAKQYVGVVPQEFNFNQFEKPIDILVNQAGYFGIPREIAVERAEKYLRQLGLWEKSHAPSRALSGGMKRRLMIARALIHEPKLLVLDEPTAGVDIELRRSMWEFLREIIAGVLPPSATRRDRTAEEDHAPGVRALERAPAVGQAVAQFEVVGPFGQNGGMVGRGRSHRERGEPPLPEPSVGAEQEWENGVKLDEHRKIPPR